MGQLSRKLRGVENGIGYWCPGCDRLHVLWTSAGSGHPAWQWDGSLDRPTVVPSVIVKTDAGKVCHHFLTNGVLSYLGDSTHALAGRVLELPDLPPELRDPEVTA